MSVATAPQSIKSKMPDKTRYIIQICHSYSPPFDDCARQYAALFSNPVYHVTTVFLSGAPDTGVVKAVNSDEVIFLDQPTSALKGLKLGIIRQIRQLTKKHPYELCVAHRTKPTYVALMATKTPVVSVHHAFGDFDRFGRRIMNNLYKDRLILLGVSNAIADDIRLHLKLWPAHKIQSLYNRVDLTTLTSSLIPREIARQKLGLPEESIIIANVGRLHPDKDQSTLIKAFAIAEPKLPASTQLIIIGEGRLEQTLRSLATSLGVDDKVKFLGRVDKARQYFRAFDLFVLSSDREPFGMVLLEAMAAELPIVASDCGGAPEIVPESAKLFEFGNHHTLAKILLDSLIHPTDAKDGPATILSKFNDDAAKSRFAEICQKNNYEYFK